MRVRYIVLVIATAGVAYAGPPLPDFSSRPTTNWPQSLAESVQREPASPALLLSGERHRRFRPRDGRDEGAESGMPILVPKVEIDPKAVVAPDGATDHKLIVKVPRVTSAPGAVRPFPFGTTDLIGRPSDLEAVIEELVGNGTTNRARKDERAGDRETLSER